MKEILTPREAAEYLSVHVRTIYRLAKNGEIPGRKVGGRWRFKKDVLDKWLSWRDERELEGVVKIKRGEERAEDQNEKGRGNIRVDLEGNTYN